MIEVQNLTKRYGSFTAVSDLSFTIEKGRIYGFLGPNGAGKSTTMNIIAGCLGATEGTVLIDGHDIFEEPVTAKKCIGYLPELPPLYTDMTPEEYLTFVMKAKGIPKGERAAQMENAVKRTGIGEVRGRMIRNLSKGYRQRVGIAQALLGNPEVIILDEPTVGLDPMQIIEIRDLIRDLGHDHTVILSSHILPEVSAVCESIMIIAHGKLVASDTPENLEKQFAGSTTLLLETPAAESEVRALLADHSALGEITCTPTEHGTTAVKIVGEGDSDPREELFFAFADARKPILEMSRKRVSLEDIFLELTQEAEKSAERPGKKKRFGHFGTSSADAPQSASAPKETPSAPAPKEGEAK